jgi:hypothetical protein
MKQGQAKTSLIGSTKTEPMSRAVNPRAVENIGTQHVYTTPKPPMYEGRGIEAPMVGQTNHHKGSQGKHK